MPDATTRKEAEPMARPVMRMAKIKYDGEFVDIIQRGSDDAGTEREIRTKSKDEPSPELVVALAAFVRYVSDLCELEAHYEVGLRVQSIAISLDGEGKRGLVVTALKKLNGAAAPLVLNTPHLTDDQWPPGLSAMLRAVETHALAYLAGHRVQIDIFAAGPQQGGS